MEPKLNKIIMEFSLETLSKNTPNCITYIYSDDYYAKTHPELVKDTFYDYTEEFKNE